MAMTTTTSGLQYEDTQPGSGAEATGGTCVMHYTGWLWTDGAKGAKFDSSHDCKSRSPSRSGAARSSKGGTKGSRE